MSATPTATLNLKVSHAGQTRRLSLAGAPAPTWHSLAGDIKKRFSLAEDYALGLSYVDEDGDSIVLDSEVEFAELWAQLVNATTFTDFKFNVVDLGIATATPAAAEGQDLVELLSNVRLAVEADPTVAFQLRGVVHDTFGRGHGHHLHGRHHRGHGGAKAARQAAREERHLAREARRIARAERRAARGSSDETSSDDKDSSTSDSSSDSDDDKKKGKGRHGRHHHYGRHAELFGRGFGAHAHRHRHHHHGPPPPPFGPNPGMPGPFGMMGFGGPFGPRGPFPPGPFDGPHAHGHHHHGRGFGGRGGFGMFGGRGGGKHHGGRHCSRDEAGPSGQEPASAVAQEGEPIQVDGQTPPDYDDEKRGHRGHGKHGKHAHAHGHGRKDKGEKDGWGWF